MLYRYLLILFVLLFELFTKAISKDICDNYRDVVYYINGMDINSFYSNCKNECSKGNLKSCANLSYLYRIGYGIKYNLEKSKKLAKKSCSGGSAFGCLNLAYLNIRNRRNTVDISDKVIQLFKKACDMGNALACNDLGVLYRIGAGVDVDFRKAFELFKKSCDAKDGFGCLNLAKLYMEGYGTSKDYEMASINFFKSCIYGSKDGCNLFNIVKHFGIEDISNYEVCLSNDSNVCVTIKFLYANQCKYDYESGYKDLDKDLALKHCLSSCKQKIGYGCYIVGKILEENGELKKAFGYYDLACNYLFVDACNTLASSYLYGYQVQKDVQRAKEYLKISCLLMDGESCFKLSEFYKNKDMKERLKLLKKSCYLGYKEGCLNYKKYKNR